MNGHHITTPTRIVIIGAGLGGTMTANRLRRNLGAQARITVIDQDGDHLYQPGLLFVPFGKARREHLVRPRAGFLHAGIGYHQEAVDSADIEAKTVCLQDGQALGYDVLVIASGATLLPDETEGLTGPGWNESVFTFYTLDGAERLRSALDTFTSGRLVVNVIDMPIKCPVAPLEFLFLADYLFRLRGVRDQIELTFATPLDAVFTKPIAAEHLKGLFDARGIRVQTEFNTGEVDGSARNLIAYDGREIPFDLAVVIPLHGGAGYIGRSAGLGDELNFVPTHPRTLQSQVRPDIFVIGDAAGIPTSKAGSVTHFEGSVIVDNIARYIQGMPLEPAFDGHANCFVETGGGKALLIDFNYDQEPVPGHYPATFGLPLLKESSANHAAKLMFEWFYWHALLAGREMPGITSRMPLSGKDLPRPTQEPKQESVR